MERTDKEWSHGVKVIGQEGSNYKNYNNHIDGFICDFVF